MRGREHPISGTLGDILDYFIFKHQYQLYYIQSDIKDLKQSFEQTGISKENPVRDKTRSFYIDENHILQGHLTSSRKDMMAGKKRPFSVIAPGRVYRVVKENATHSIVSHQIEGVIADDQITLHDLITQLEDLYYLLFQEHSKYTPDFTVFASPTVQFYIPCHVCKGTGCPSCYYLGELTWSAGGLSEDEEGRRIISFSISLDRLSVRKAHIDDCRKMYFR